MGQNAPHKQRRVLGAGGQGACQPQGRRDMLPEAESWLVHMWGPLVSTVLWGGFSGCPRLDRHDHRPAQGLTFPLYPQHLRPARGAGTDPLPE